MVAANFDGSEPPELTRPQLLKRAIHGYCWNDRYVPARATPSQANLLGRVSLLAPAKFNLV